MRPRPPSGYRFWFIRTLMAAMLFTTAWGVWPTLWPRDAGLVPLAVAGPWDNLALLPLMPGEAPLESKDSVVTAGADVPLTGGEAVSRWLDPQARVQVSALPIALRAVSLVETSPPTQIHHLTVETPGVEPRELEPAIPGPLPGCPGIALTGFEPWGGLYPTPNGEALCALTLRQEGAPEAQVFLSMDAPSILPFAGLAIASWHAGEDAARPVLEGPPQVGLAPRWGIMRDGAVQWFESFEPGSGCALSDGAGVRLLATGPDDGAGPAWIDLVMAEPSLEPRILRVEANTINPPFRLECAGPKTPVILVHCWPLGAWVALWTGHEWKGPVQLADGRSCAPEGENWRMRLDGVSPSAVAIPKETSALICAVVKMGEQEIRIREGERRELSGTGLTYARATHGGAYRCLLQCSKGGEPVEAELKTEDPVRWAGWRFSLIAVNPGDNAAVLIAVGDAHIRWKWLAGALVLGGFLVLGLRSRLGLKKDGNEL